MVDKLTGNGGIRQGVSPESVQGTPAQPAPDRPQQGVPAQRARARDAIDRRPAAQQAVSAQIARPLDGAFAASAAYRPQHAIPPALGRVLQDLAKKPDAVRQLMAPFYT